MASDSLISMRRPSALDESWTPRGLEQGDGAAQFLEPAGPGAVNGGRERAEIETGQLGKRRRAFLGREARVAWNPSLRGLVERASCSREQRLAAAMTQGELTAAADLLGERAARSRRRRHEWPEPDAAAPQHERD